MPLFGQKSQPQTPQNEEVMQYANLLADEANAYKQLFMAQGELIFHQEEFIRHVWQKDDSIAFVHRLDGESKNFSIVEWAQGKSDLVRKIGALADLAVLSNDKRKAYWQAHLA